MNNVADIEVFKVTQHAAIAKFITVRINHD